MTDTTSHTPHRGAWIAPLLSTLLTLPAALLSSMGVAFAGMSCDVGTSAEIRQCNASAFNAGKVFFYGLLLPLGLLLSSWCLPWQQRHRSIRSALALLTPFSVIVLYLVFDSLVDWPPSP
ncbi:hypothetical protein [Streptomyces sp. SAJ15]|uniref:hypothetical protein n=1 Tax=Streptomyces sp. SAJ15 TaxID=2011095 RepID=UPI001186325E|nr:hypothetical protein [Streptomyces sp. SAJ15]TVL94154.1 hypothetical protein CD790_03925 [Streptomyces sp. SAJ15]